MKDSQYKFDGRMGTSLEIYIYGALAGQDWLIMNVKKYFES
jgi:hypothetical protein